ncbi:glucose-induced degradation complex subunit VID30 [Sugiyamaella lignohabitans]|uniref:Glucose-induced degradation complex subunit VID30 n=1 Tax=Sugiyamaella lignohabitans TaxID=796027 RepID=A0A167F2W8_9ASCO|nr:glucose-induced degradation complex subunit VID30 [Sugiyamaella lignohabitans]ANB14758.1 glucose-induced degradation complex subunit VID30 [Sugiyamaella lignohabitans]
MSPVNRGSSVSTLGTASVSSGGSPEDSRFDEDGRTPSVVPGVGGGLSSGLSDSLSVGSLSSFGAVGLGLPASVPKIPGYLALTAYGERFYSFLELDRPVSGDVSLGSNGRSRSKSMSTVSRSVGGSTGAGAAGSVSGGSARSTGNGTSLAGSISGLSAGLGSGSGFDSAGSGAGSGGSNSSGSGSSGVSGSGSGGRSSGSENQQLEVTASEFNLPQMFPSRRAAELDALGMWQYPRAPATSLPSSSLSLSAIEVPLDMYLRSNAGRRVYRDGNWTEVGSGSTGSTGQEASSVSADNSATTGSGTGSRSSEENQQQQTVSGLRRLAAGSGSGSGSGSGAAASMSISSLTSSSSASTVSQPNNNNYLLNSSSSSSSNTAKPLSSTSTLGSNGGLSASRSGTTVDSSIPSRKDIGLPPLPTRWAKPEIDQNVGLDSEGTRIDYSVVQTKPSSSSSSPHSVAVLKTSHAIPPLCGVFYYEVEVLEHGIEEFISVGICDIEAGLTKVPGMDSRTWGFHGDDGRISAGQSQSKSFGPKINVGDVIGCGVNFYKDSIFYTKNGLPLGTAFQDVKGILFPCIGLKSGEIVHTNFGSEEFRFDIEEYVMTMKNKVLTQIDLSKPPANMIDELDPVSGRSGASNSDPDDTSKDWRFIKDIVASYFNHVGYIETAKAFDKERKNEEKAINFEQLDDESSLMDIDETPNNNNNNDEDDEMLNEEDKKMKLDVLNRQRIRSYILDEDIDGALKLLNVFYPTVLEDNYLIKFKMHCRKFVSLVRKSIPSASSSSSPSSSTSTSHRDYLNAAIQYGQDLRKEYKNDTNPTITSTLSTIFSLLAYEDPGSSPELAYIISNQELVPLAEELNSAILVSQGKPAVPSLQRLAEHCTQLVWELSDQGYHPSSLLNVKRDFLDT